MEQLNITDQARKLMESRGKWDAEERARSNVKLYELLTGCYEILLNIKSNENRIKDIKDLLYFHDIRYLSKTDAAGLIIKLVFGADRQRTYQYATVLRIACEQKKTAAELAGWIKESGGVQEIRRTNGEEGDDKKAKAKNEKANSKNIVKDAVSVLRNRDGDFTNMKKPTKTSQSYDGIVVGIGVDQGDGTVKIVEFADAEIVEMVLKKLGQQYAKDGDLDAVKQAAIDAENKATDAKKAAAMAMGAHAAEEPKATTPLPELTSEPSHWDWNQN